jgi:hypothetical protein
MRRRQRTLAFIRRSCACGTKPLKRARAGVDCRPIWVSGRERKCGNFH